jgi:pimeloyl-ACP methyl ester carboxylesterase
VRISASFAAVSFAPDLLRVPVGAGALHVARWGHSAQHVVLLHGFGTHAFLWRHVGPLLARADLVAWAFDLLGHGESDRPADADFGLAAQAEALHRALTALGISDATVVGVDLGAAVALRMAASHPEVARQLVLISPMSAEECPSGDVDQLPADAARLALRLGQGVLGAAPLLEGLLARQWRTAESGPPLPLMARYVAPYVGRDGARHLLALGASLDSGEAVDAEAAAVTCPVLVLRGESERWISEAQCRQLAAAVPFGRYEVVPGAGRLVPEDAAEWLAERVSAVAKERPLALGKRRTAG